MKSYIVLLVSFLFVSLFCSCDDDDNKDGGWKPESPKFDVVCENGKLEVAENDTLVLKVKMENIANTIFTWKVEGVEVAADTICAFVGKKLGDCKISVNAVNEGGETTVDAVVNVYGKYKYGTFILNEGQQFAGRGGTLCFISPKGVLTDSVYYRENGGRRLGMTTQDLYIHDGKMYIISQLGNYNQFDGGYITVLNAETLKEIRVHQDELDGELFAPTHLAVLSDEEIYIRDEEGINKFNSTTKELVFVEGSEHATKTAMAVAHKRVFAAAGSDIIVIENGSIVKRIAETGTISGVIRSSDGNIWYSCGANGDNPAKIVKLNAEDYSTKVNQITDAGAADILKGGFFATPYITAKADTIYMCSIQGFMGVTPVYRHLFSENKTEAVLDIAAKVSDIMTMYNGIAVHPITGDIYVNTIAAYSPNKENKTSVFSLQNGQFELAATYKGHVLNSAGTFFTYNFE